MPSPHRLATAACLLLAATANGQAASMMTVQVDPRVELLGVVFRLAEAREYTQARVPDYAAAVDAHFGAHREHAAVGLARALRQSHGIGYDAVASFAIHLRGIDPPALAAAAGERPARLEARWTTADAHAFAAALADFVRDSDAAAFFAARNELWSTTAARLREVVEQQVRAAWFEQFFGERPRASFRVVPALLHGPSNYGPNALAADGAEELYAILGCGTVDAAGLPTFDRTIVPTLVHEYCHSFCNPLVDSHLASLQAAGDALFARTEAVMRRQAYANGRTLLCESLVRACVVRYRHAADGKAGAAEEVAEQHQRGFTWTGALAQLLAERYEGDRKRFPTLDRFAPELAAFFAAQPAALDAAAAKAPKVAAMVPANGASDVDPATTALVVTFDRPMRDGGWSVVGGGERFPKTTGKPSYDAARTVLTIPVQLEPDHDYELWLNRGRFDSFRAADGTPLAPVHVTFRTRGR